MLCLKAERARDERKVLEIWEPRSGCHISGSNSDTFLLRLSRPNDALDRTGLPITISLVSMPFVPTDNPQTALDTIYDAPKLAVPDWRLSTLQMPTPRMTKSQPPNRPRSLSLQDSWGWISTDTSPLEESHTLSRTYPVVCAIVDLHLD